jgi:cyclohexanone monooxygenase
VLEISEHIAYVVSRMRDRGIERVEASGVAEQEWVQLVRGSIPDTHVEFFRNCTPGFYNNYGELEAKLRRGAYNFLGGSVMFYDLLRKWRAEDDLAGLELR